MRTTIQLDEHLHKQAKEYALSRGQTFAALVEDALREKLAARAEAGDKKTVRLKTVTGYGIQPGVDIDDNASLLDLMDAK